MKSRRDGDSVTSRHRVLHVITRLIVGGAQENTLLTVEGLQRDGWEVDVAAGLQTGAEGSLWEVAEAQGLSSRPVRNLVREINPLKDSLALAALFQMMRKRKYSIVHTHSSKAGILGRLAARMAGVPVIVHTVHGWGFHEHMSAPRRALFILLERVTAHFTNCLITVSSSDQKLGLTHGIGKADRYRLIRSGIELDRFAKSSSDSAQLRIELGIPEGRPVVGSVTRLSPQKAPLDLGEAIVRVGRAMPEVQFVIVGDGPQRPDLERYLGERDLLDRTLMVGLREDVENFLPLFDVFVLSSLWEGLPRVLPQAMAAGLPIVCTGTEGSREAVVEGENGFLVAPGATGDMAARILALLGDAEARQRMGKTGRARVRQFDVVTMVEEIENLYNLLLKRKA